jgi:NADP-dependent 3-hydroxy acid dehydrogenase YdfG
MSLSALATRITERDGDAITITADVRNLKAMEHAVLRTLERFGGRDVLPG